jgi:hypothetical protein
LVLYADSINLLGTEKDESAQYKIKNVMMELESWFFLFVLKGPIADAMEAPQP